MVVAVGVVLGAGSSRAALAGDAAGVPFVTFAHATAAGNYGLACEQIATRTLMPGTAPGPSTRADAEKACILAVASTAKEIDAARRRSLASTRLVKVRLNGDRASVTVQTTLYGVHPRSTGTAILEDGQWRISQPALGAHVGSSLVERIPSESMAPTLRPGDTILANQAAYRHTTPRIGDIVLFHPPDGAVTMRCGKRRPPGQACATATPRNSTAIFVKRVVALPGDRVSIRDGRVIRNGNRATEAFITPCPRGERNCDYPRTFTVAPGRYYLLGDNRGSSYDSRNWGPIRASSIIGRVRRLGP